MTDAPVTDDPLAYDPAESLDLEQGERRPLCQHQSPDRRPHA